MPEQKVLPVDTLRPEAKVTSAGIVTYLVSVGILAATEAAGTIDFASFLPPGWAQVLLLPVIPSIIAAVAGWVAPHTKRIGRTPIDPQQQ